MSDPLLLLGASARFFLRHPGQLALTLLGIALGTAAIVAVAIANRAAGVSFDRSLDALAGPVTHELRARDGDTFDEALYPALRSMPGLRAALPLLELSLTLDGTPAVLAGLDPLAMPAGGASGALLDAGLMQVLTTPGGVFLPKALADQLGARRGDALPARTAGAPLSLRVLGILGNEDGEGFGSRAIADISVVQDLAGMRGSLSSVQLVLDADAATRLRDTLPPGVELVSREQQRADFDAMTRAFRTNLTAMSLLAVLVGAFLVYNAMTFAVVQRRAAFGILRMVGVTPRQLFRGLLLEAATLGSVGALLGAALGVVLAQGLLVLVTRTVSDLYVRIDPLQPGLSSTELAVSGLVTIGAVLLATLAPAWEAARTPPVSLGHGQAGTGVAAHRFPLPGLGVALMLGCPLLLLLADRSLAAAFVALFLLIAGFGLATPPVLRAMLCGGERLARRRLGTLQHLALRGVIGALPRLSPAVVALSIAVAATVGVTTMIGSFRSSVDAWLGSTLQGDLYVYPQRGGALAAPWPEAVARLPGVAAVTVLRDRELQLEGERIRVLLLDEQAWAGRGFDLVAAIDDAVARALGDGEGLLVSEPLASRLTIVPGDEMELTTGVGPVALPVLGVYRDYGSSRGAAVLAYTRYLRHWEPLAPSSLALVIGDGADVAVLRQRLADLSASLEQPLEVVSPQAIRERSLAIFDRTFAITDVLRVLVVMVAFVGIVSALLALFLERRREFALLRATGMTPRQLQALVLGQAGLAGLSAGVLALPLGLALAVLLIDVINRRSFGWTMRAELDPAVFWQAPLLAVLAAMLAALWPARRVAGGALREALEAP